MRLLITASVASLLHVCLAANAADWRSRTIYQVFTDRFSRTDGSTDAPCNTANNIYCGGTWKGLENKLDYIKNMGFTAVWISPVTKQVAQAYHGYYQTDLYSVNTNFGTADDLKSLASALHAKGMYLMVDVVPNHMGYPGCADKVDYSTFNPFNKANQYHSYCPITDYQNQTQVEQCWIGDCTMEMPDIKTENTDVANELNKWIKTLVSDYSIDGLRIDSVKNVNKDFFPSWCQSAGVFCMGEVSDGQATYTYPYQAYVDSVFDYPLYYSMTRVFQQQTPMSDIVVSLAACVDNQDFGCKDSTLLGTFLENHDNPRFAHVTQDLSLVKNAMAFVALGDGIPVVYQGQEQHYQGGDDPGCREALWLSDFNTTSPLYKHTALINNVRNHVSARSSTFLGYQTRVLTYTDTEIQMRKDVLRTVFSNQGAGAPTWTLTTQGMEFDSGKTVVDVMSCAKYTAKDTGEVDVQMVAGLPAILLQDGSLSGSGLCGY